MAHLSSTGNVNLTSATNWSPTQVPAPGDHLYIYAHTLTIDADTALSTIYLNNASSRLAIDGASQQLNVETLRANVALSAPAITLVPGQELSITMRFGIFFVQAASQPLFMVSGGTLNLYGHDQNPDSDLMMVWTIPAGPANVQTSRLFTSNHAGSVIRTVGRLSVGAGTHSLVNMAGGTWTHEHAGVTEFNSVTHSAKFINVSGSNAATISFTGDVSTTVPVSSTGIVVLSGGNCVTNWTGEFYSTVPHGAGALFYQSAGVMTLTGNLGHASGSNSLSLWIAGGVFNWADQSVVVAPERTFTMLASAGTFNITNLNVLNHSKWVGILYGSATGSAVGSVITNAPGASSCINFLTPTFIGLDSDSPVLPSVHDVAAGTEYGYDAAPLVGTGLVLDPAVLASAVGSAIDDVETFSEATLHNTITLLSRLNEDRAAWLDKLEEFDPNGSLTNNQLYEALEDYRQTYAYDCRAVIERPGGMLDGVPSASSIANQVWSAANRTLSTFSDSSGITTLLSRITGVLRTKSEDDAADAAILEKLPESGRAATPADVTITVDGGGDATAANQAAIADAISAVNAKLSTRPILQTPVIEGGQIQSPLIIGDDYLAIHDRAFVWPIDTPPGVSAETASCSFGIAKADTGVGFAVDGEILPDGSTWQLVFELPRSVTTGLAPGAYRWSVEVRDGDGNELTRMWGNTLQLRGKQT